MGRQRKAETRPLWSKTGSLVGFGPFLGLQLLAAQLADHGLREREADLDGSDSFVLAELGVEPIGKLFGGWRGSFGLQRDERFRAFAAMVVGDSDDERLLHRGVPVEDGLDHAREDLE